MPVSSNDFIEWALQSLETNPNSEICSRNAVSRAYYGLYHAANDAANHAGYPEFGGTAHESLAFRFKNANRKTEAYRLQDLHRARCVADYKINESGYTLDLAKKLVLSCADLAKKL